MKFYTTARSDEYTVDVFKNLKEVCDYIDSLFEFSALDVLDRTPVTKFNIFHWLKGNKFVTVFELKGERRMLQVQRHTL